MGNVHIALVNQWYPPDYGGVGVYNSAMARAYAALGHRVTVMTARSAADQPAVADEDGVRAGRLETFHVGAGMDARLGHGQRAGRKVRQ